eukprot:Sspe_Gene.7484::Locus_2535_Transcript_4_5_Confidence_0.455_Length_1679::g.7484::m.7484
MGRKMGGLNFTAWAQALTNGETVTIKVEVGNDFVLTNAAAPSVKSATRVTIGTDEMVTLCTLTPANPNAKMAITIPGGTTVKVAATGGAVHLMGFEAHADPLPPHICESDPASLPAASTAPNGTSAGAKLSPKQSPKAAPAKPSPKAVAQPSPKVAPKQSPKAAPKKSPKTAPKQSPKAAPKKSPKAAPQSEPLELKQPKVAQEKPAPKSITFPEPELNEHYEAEEIEAGELILKGQKYFINWRNFQVFKGSIDDAEPAGWFHPDEKAVKDHPPVHEAPEKSAVVQSAKKMQKEKLAMRRQEWDSSRKKAQKRPAADDSSDETIDTDEEMNAYAAKRLQAAKAKRR